MGRMKRPILLYLILTLAAICVRAQTPAPPKAAGLDTAAIDRAIGKSGQVMPGDVYRVAFPRSDLNVTVGSVKVKAGFALGGLAAFKATGSSAVGACGLLPTGVEVHT